MKRQVHFRGRIPRAREEWWRRVRRLVEKRVIDEKGFDGFISWFQFVLIYLYVSSYRRRHFRIEMVVTYLERYLMMSIRVSFGDHLPPPSSTYPSIPATATQHHARSYHKLPHHVQIPTASLSLVADLALPAGPPYLFPLPLINRDENEL